MKELQELQEAADKGKWGRFVMLMGRPQAKRKDFPISLAKQWNDKPNRYKEPKGEEIIGIAWAGAIFPTRIHQWTIHLGATTKLKTPVEHIEPGNERAKIISLRGADPEALEYCQ